eukprot:6207515-Pleurochrysis_carterae.AAC.1
MCSARTCCSRAQSPSGSGEHALSTVKMWVRRLACGVRACNVRVHPTYVSVQMHPRRCSRSPVQRLQHAGMARTLRCRGDDNDHSTEHTR